MFLNVVSKFVFSFFSKLVLLRCILSSVCSNSLYNIQNNYVFMCHVCTDISMYCQQREQLTCAQNVSCPYSLCCTVSFYYDSRCSKKFVISYTTCCTYIVITMQRCCVTTITIVIMPCNLALFSFLLIIKIRHIAHKLFANTIDSQRWETILSLKNFIAK